MTQIKNHVIFIPCCLFCIYDELYIEIDNLIKNFEFQKPATAKYQECLRNKVAQLNLKVSSMSMIIHIIS